MTIRQRLFLSFFLILALFALNVAIHRRANERRTESLESIRQAIDRQDLVLDIGRSLDERREAAANLALLAEAGTSLESAQVVHLGSLLEEIEASIEQLRELSSLDNRPKVESLALQFGHLQAGWRSLYRQLEKRAKPEPDAPRSPKAAARLGEVGQMMTGANSNSGASEPVDVSELEAFARTAESLVDQLVTAESQAVETASTRFREQSAFSDRVTSGLFLATSLLALAIALAFSSYLDRGLETLGRGARRIGRGELDHRIQVRGRDELAELAQAFNKMSTNLREAQERVDEAREAAEEASRAKSSFLANMSHELRTPLNVIIGYTEMLLEDSQEQQIEGFGSDLQRILTASRHLTALIDDILDLSKIEAAKMTLHVEPFEIRALVEEVCATIEPLVRQKSNRLEVDVDRGVRAMTSDKTKTRQILLNLLSNACKFTSEGVITLRVRRTSSAPGDRLLFEVRDTGIGIRNERLDTIFEAFAQAETTTSANYGGTGLGLALCKKLSHLMGGDIRAESVVGQGSGFFVELPASLQPTSGEIAMPAITSGTLSMPSQLESAVILGDPATYHRVQQRLTESGLAVASATSAGEAVVMARTVRTRGIVVDLLDPRCEGLRALGELVGEEGTKDLPVIAFSLLESPGAELALGPARLLVSARTRRRLRRCVDELDAANRAGRVLVVTSGQETIAPLTRGLEQRGWAIESTPGGAEGQPSLDSDPPDLIIIDATARCESTESFIERARQDVAWRLIPILELVDGATETASSAAADLALVSHQAFEPALQELVNALANVSSTPIASTLAKQALRESVRQATGPQPSAAAQREATRPLGMIVASSGGQEPAQR